MDADRDLEARLSTVEQVLAELDTRLRVLERGALPLATVRAPAARPEGSLPPDVTIGADLVGTFTLIGRTVVIFAGAYLLRALTESGILERSTGALLGMVYALAWTAVAYRVAPRHRLSATFFGACTVLIGFPLLGEATTRFALLTPSAGALALTATTGAVLVTAWRGHLQALAWVATIGGCLLASLLFVITATPLPFTMFLIALGIATLWLGYDREWTLLRWVVAFFADLAVLLLIDRAMATPALDPPSQVIAVQWLLVAGYLGSVAIRTLVRGRTVIPFEAVQTGAMLLAGLAGALAVARHTGAGALMLGPGVLALSLASYTVALVDRRQARGVNFYFFTSLALVFALTGCEFVLDGAALGGLYVALSALAAWTARQSGRATLAAHAVIYLFAAAVATALVETVRQGLFASPRVGWAPVSVSAGIVLAAAALCWRLTTPAAAAVPSRTAQAFRRTLAGFLVISLAGVAVVVVRSILPPEAPSHAAMLATLRTGVLAAAAVMVASLGRYAATREFGALLYPLLAWAALKLVVEDFPTSPPALLFVALAMYGGALIAGPRIARMPPPVERAGEPARAERQHVS